MNASEAFGRCCRLLAVTACGFIENARHEQGGATQQQ